MEKINLRIALVLLQDEDGRFALQLRSPIASIANPDRWGIFGGHIEDGEKPEAGALREIQEELACLLDAGKLKMLDSFQMDSDKEYFVYFYPVEDELRQARLMEGEDFDFFAIEEIEQGMIRGKEVVSYHRDVMRKFVDGKYSG